MGEYHPSDEGMPLSVNHDDVSQRVFLVCLLMLNPIVNSKIGCSAITRCAGLAATCKFSGRLTGYQDPAILYATLKSQIHCQYNISPCSVHGYRSDSGCSCTGNPWLPSLLPQQRSRLGKSSPLQRILFPLARSQSSMHFFLVFASSDPSTHASSSPSGSPASTVARGLQSSIEQRGRSQHALRFAAPP